MDNIIIQKKVRSLLIMADEANNLGNFSHAHHCYSEILKIDPNNSVALEGKINSLIKWGDEASLAGNTEEAHHYYTMALDASKDDDTRKNKTLSEIAVGLLQSNRYKHYIYTETNIKEEPNLCFILMPYGPKWSRPLYDRHIYPVCKMEGLNPIRADDIYGVRGIMQDVWTYINRALIVIADLTTKNPNVFYEVGMAHALGKDVILISQSIDDVPFDLRGVRFIEYSIVLDGPSILENKLKLTLQKVIHERNDQINQILKKE